MDTKLIEIKSKGTSLGEHEYEFPENLQEAIDVDGEDKVYKLYSELRTTRWRDAKRRELTGGGVPKDLIKAIKDSTDPDVIAKVAELLGLEI